MVQEIGNSYVDQQQKAKERRDVIKREERGLEKCKAEKARTQKRLNTQAHSLTMMITQVFLLTKIMITQAFSLTRIMITQAYSLTIRH